MAKITTSTEQNKFWIGKRAKIEIHKDGHKLKYTAIILDMDVFQITFKDRDGEIFSFNRELVKEMRNF